jgi:hypothetical protein
VTLTDDEYVARVQGAAASLRARNAAWLEAINHIKVPAVHEAVMARFDSNGTLVEFDIVPSALSDYTNTELEQIITDVLRNTHQALHAQMMELFATYMAPNSPQFDPNALGEPYVDPPN